VELALALLFDSPFRFSKQQAAKDEEWVPGSDKKDP
jgi:hypothetical protein